MSISAWAKNHNRAFILCTVSIGLIAVFAVTYVGHHVDQGTRLQLEAEELMISSDVQHGEVKDNKENNGLLDIRLPPGLESADENANDDPACAYTGSCTEVEDVNVDEENTMEVMEESKEEQEQSSPLTKAACMSAMEQAYWKDLTIEQTNAVTLLGYNQESWDCEESEDDCVYLDEEYRSKAWNDLTHEVQQIYEAFCYDETSWNEEVVNRTVHDADECRIAIEHSHWNQLTKDQMDAAMFLGYTKESWDCVKEEEEEGVYDESLCGNPDSLNKSNPWTDLPAEVQHAYGAFCFDETSWDEYVTFLKEKEDYEKQQENESVAADLLRLQYPLLTPDEETTLLSSLQTRMQSHDLNLSTNLNNTTTRQFIHLHHMKTGGTSLGRLLSCAMSRAKNNVNDPKNPFLIPYYSLSECSGSYYQACITNKSDCFQKIDKSAVMSYCAPLFQAEEFGWINADKVTVLRHPVDRVWSMFRFKTQGCFNCMPLIDVYKYIDEGTEEENVCGGKKCHGVCMDQLLNHQTRNMLTTPASEEFTLEQQLEEVLYNLRNQFTVVGLTEDMPNTAKMVGQVFPWMNATYNGMEKTCELPHANASPKNNYCGKDRGHWDLPDHPDEETREAIIRHNQLDMAMYEEAVRHFERQKVALGWN